ncbi:MAG: substrate-binding domain-containing protein [Methylocystaceae bacterium]|nr:substrate-binding domain-containing protein [Methylocystaceae bacterium]
MKKITVAFLCLIFFTAISYADADLHKYWSYQEYLALHPEQVEISKAFAERIKGPVESWSPLGKHTVKIAVIYPGLQASDYWRRSISSFEARLREQKVPYIIHPFFTKPGHDIRLQEKLINLTLKNKPDYLIFTLDVLRHEEIIKRLIAKGTPKVIVQNATRPVRAWGDAQPFLYVGFDHAFGSQLLADKFMQIFPKGTDYTIFCGTNGFVSAARGNTFKDTVAKLPNSKVTAVYHLDFDRERARKATLHLISRNKMPPFVYACSTDLALGVIDAAKEKNILDKIAVNGWGGGSDELKALSKKELDFTVMRINDDNGVAMAEAIYLDLINKRNEIPQVFSGDIVLLDQSTPADKIEKLKEHAFRYSNHWHSHLDQILRFVPYEQ